MFLIPQNDRKQHPPSGAKALEGADGAAARADGAAARADGAAREGAAETDATEADGAATGLETGILLTPGTGLLLAERTVRSVGVPRRWGGRTDGSSNSAKIVS